MGNSSDAPDSPFWSDLQAKGQEVMTNGAGKEHQTKPESKKKSEATRKPKGGGKTK